MVATGVHPLSEVSFGSVLSVFLRNKVAAVREKGQWQPQNILTRCSLDTTFTSWLSLSRLSHGEVSPLTCRTEKAEVQEDSVD